MSSVRRTNQVLYFARMSLDHSAKAESAQDKRYSEECALFHLYCAVTSLVGELVGQYALASFESLDELLARPGLPSELKELALLLSDSGSWLNALSKQYFLLTKQGFNGSVASGGLILSESDYSGLFANWLIELEKVTQRMREHYQEN